MHSYHCTFQCTRRDPVIDQRSYQIKCHPLTSQPSRTLDAFGIIIVYGHYYLFARMIAWIVLIVRLFHNMCGTQWRRLVAIDQSSGWLTWLHRLARRAHCSYQTHTYTIPQRQHRLQAGQESVLYLQLYGISARVYGRRISITLMAHQSGRSRAFTEHEFSVTCR